MDIPTDRKYGKTHEWYLVEGDIITVGITQYAADELTDITYVELPEVGSGVTAGEAFGEVESVKATSELLSAVSGTVTEINTELADQPELVNEDPFGKGWMVKLKVDSPGALGSLLDAAAYESSIG